MRATLQKIIHYATQAPSCRNDHPWKFRSEGCCLYIYPDYSRHHKHMSADCHELFISLGCAVENAVVAANAYGYRERVSYHFDEEPHYVRLELEPTDTTGNEALFLAIGAVTPATAPAGQQYIPADQLAALVLQARERDVFLKVYDTDEEVARLLPLVEEAAVLQYRDKDFPDWVRVDLGQRAGAAEGAWGEPVGGLRVPAWMGRLYTDHIAQAKASARKVRQLVQSSAALVLFATINNTPEGWVNLGRSYQRVGLKATALGIRHAPFNLPLEEESVREKLKRDLDDDLEEPLLMMRLGYAEVPVGEELQKEHSL